eukprot:TRINITY_DN5473_c0_g1_i1.p1 TRINITY_DN5473_c0_g1~~TRINITY_DN5473_c0_g1_i1.p1  ORF type:complete len:205 (-),score=27.03 TRINITY_DN5473_c0_g1_i1:475-1041(-)
MTRTKQTARKKRTDKQQSKIKKRQISVNLKRQRQKANTRSVSTNDEIHNTKSVSTNDEIHDTKTERSRVKRSNLQEQMKQKLDGSQFRWINEQLYSTTGAEALKLMHTNPERFDIYHRGFRGQVSKWPQNPVDSIIEWLSKQPRTLVVADMGCGEAKIAQSVEQTVHSYDLIATNDKVEVCDIAHVCT